MDYTDTQLKQALAKMLPKKLRFLNNVLWHKGGDRPDQPVLDTELLQLCWLVEETFKSGTVEDARQGLLYGKALFDADADWCIHATWQQRVIALAKVKGITI